MKGDVGMGAIRRKKIWCESGQCGRSWNAGEERMGGTGIWARTGNLFLLFFVSAFLLCLTACGAEEEPLQIAFYYENVCASCEGDADFYALYNRCISQEEKESLNVEIATYNVFMDSCKERYEKEAERLEIPQGTSMPVLIIGDQWFGGYTNMEEALHRVLIEK